MSEKRHYAMGLTDAHLKIEAKRRAFLVDDELLIFGVFDNLTSTPENAEAVECMTDALGSFLGDNRRVIDRYTQSGGYYHRIRATLTVEMAFQQATRSARTALAIGPLPRLTMVMLAGRNAMIVRHFPAEVFHIRDQKVRHITKVLPGQGVRGDSGVKGANSKSAIARARRESPLTGMVSAQGSGGPGGSGGLGGSGNGGVAGSHRAPKLEFFHTESKPGDVYVVGNEVLGGHLAEAWNPDTQADREAHEHTSDSLRKVVRQVSLTQPDKVVTGMIIKIVGAANADELKLEERVAPLRSIPVFKALQTNELLKVLQLMEVREFKAWERIISEDEPGELLYIGVKGKYNVYKKNSLIAELSEGAVFGEIGFINKLPRTADVVATEKTTMLVLSRSKIRKLLATEPQIASHLLWSLCQILTDRLAATTVDLAKLMEMTKNKGENITLMDGSDDGRYSSRPRR